MNFKGRAAVAFCLALFMIFSFAVVSFAQPADITGHWAEKQIADWTAKDLAKGYPDGTFLPDSTITRAEFITLVNRAFGFTKSEEITFSDVLPTDWFAGEIARAKAAGYITGYEDNTIRPDAQIERQEVAAILTRLLSLDTSAGSDLSSFQDSGSVPGWSRAGIAAVVRNNLMKGYPDMTFQAQNPITRAEAIVTLDRALAFKTPVHAAKGISGIVTSDGIAVSGATVRVFPAGDYHVAKTVTTGSDGKYTVEVPAGKYDLTAGTADAVAVAAGVELAANGAVSQNLALAPAAVISGTISNSDNTKVAKAQVLFTATPTFIANTDSNGAYTVAVLPKQTYTVRVYNPDKPADDPVTINANLPVGAAGAQNVGGLTVAFTSASSPPGGGGGGGGGGTIPIIVPPVSDTVVNDAIASSTTDVVLAQPTAVAAAVTPTQLTSIANTNKPLTVDLQNNVQFNIPAQAVSELAASPAQVQIVAEPATRVLQPSNHAYMVAGQVFDLKVETVTNNQVQTVTFTNPISITLPINASPGPGQVVKVFRYNDSSRQWEEIGGTDNGNGTITITRNTFSTYAPLIIPNEPITITLDSATVSAQVSHILDATGNVSSYSAVCDLSTYSSSTKVISGTVTVASGGTLTLTTPTIPFLARGLTITQQLQAGLNSLDVVTYLGSKLPTGGLTLTTLRSVFGNVSTLDLTGNLTNSATGHSATARLTIKLP